MTDSQIANLLLENMSHIKIARILHIGRDRIRDVKKSNESGIPIIRKKSGPNKITSPMRARVVQLTLYSGARSDTSVAQMVSKEFRTPISRSSVNMIRHEERFNYKPPKVCQLLTKDHLQERLQFTSSYLNGEFPTTNLIFSDESRFVMQSDNQWVWRRRGSYDESIFSPKQKFPQWILIWGAIGVGFKSSLIIFEGTVTGPKYIAEIRKSGTFDKADATFGERNYFFVQDGATSHWTSAVFQDLAQQCNVFPVWPPNSPDLNPIESLWGALKRIVKRSQITSVEDLTAVVQTCWENFPQEDIDHLVSSFNVRVRLVNEAKGRSIQPLISSHITILPSHYATYFECNYWSPEEDALLFSKINCHGIHWKRLALFFPSRNVSSVRKRFDFLMRRQYLKQD